MAVKYNKQTGKWEFVFDAGIHPQTGRRKQIRRRGFATRAEAVNAYAKIKAEVIDGNYLSLSDTTYENYMNEYWNERKIALQASTYEIHTMYFRTIINPALGRLKLREINHFQIQNFVNVLANDTTYSSHTIHLIFRIVYSSFKNAVFHKLIKENPCENITLPKRTKRKMTVWSLEQVNYFLRESIKIPRVTRCLIGFQIGLLTGLRQGEILGLRWQDIDFDKRIIYVKQTLTQKGEIKEGAKTEGSIRSVSMPERLVIELLEHREKLLDEKAKCRTTYYDNDLVVPTRDGQPLIPRNFRKEFYNLTDQLGLPRIRFHDTRHTHATMLIAQNVNVKLIAERLGHDDIQTTLNTYSHVLPNMQRTVSDKLDEILE